MDGQTGSTVTLHPHSQPCPPPRCTPQVMLCPPCHPRHGRPAGAEGWDTPGARRRPGALPWGEQAAPRVGRRPSPLHLGACLQSRDSPPATPPAWGGGCSIRASHLGIAFGRAKSDRALSASAGWLPTGLIATGLTSRSQDCSAGPFPAAGRGDGESRAQPALQRAGKSRSGLALKGGMEPRSRWLPSEATEQRRLPEPGADVGNRRPGNVGAHPEHPRPGSCGGRGHPWVPLPARVAVHAIPCFAGKQP